MPYFKQRLRANLVDAVRWRQRSYLGAFVWAASVSALLLITMTVFVVNPDVPRSIQVAFSGSPTEELTSGMPAESAPIIAMAATNPSPSRPHPPYLAGGVSIPRVEMVPSTVDPDAELVRRMAAASSESETVDARPVGSMQVREYELSNGQRVMVLDRVQPRESRTRRAQPAIYY